LGLGSGSGLGYLAHVLRISPFVPLRPCGCARPGVVRAVGFDDRGVHLVRVRGRGRVRVRVRVRVGVRVRVRVRVRDRVRDRGEGFGLAWRVHIVVWRVGVVLERPVDLPLGDLPRVRAKA
jgi:hypothetical protein